MSERHAKFVEELIKQQLNEVKENRSQVKFAP